MTQDFIPFNLNYTIKVKLRPRGAQVLNDYYTKYMLTPPKIDEHGYLAFQAWDFINIFGESFAAHHCWMDPPVEMTILVENKLTEFCQNNKLV